MKSVLLSLLLTAVTATAAAQEASYDLGGYIKYLLDRSSLPGTAPTTDQLLHARLNARWFPGAGVSAGAEFRARAYEGGLVGDTPDFLSTVRSEREFARLDATLWQTRQSLGYAEVDRLWADWAGGPWEATLGRQRVAWGTALVWNPTDIFNPFSVLDFDYEERPAVDGLRVQYFTGAVSKVEAVFKPGRSPTSAAAAVAFTTDVGGYDFHLLGGRRGGCWLTGGSWAGDIAGGGFRGELLVSQVAALQGSPAAPAGGTDGVMASAVLSGDYTFSDSWYVHLESLYNSAGARAQAAVSADRARALGLLSPARWTLWVEFARDVTPLVRASIFVMNDPDDGSNVYGPSVTWSAAKNLDVLAIALIATGDPETAFGPYGRTVFGRLKWSF
ncbi:MAG TPA: hypothetical protein VMM80_09875 [Bacteroidota bacterium]|nr:hypothetical protein [Bacteroidota bacterium]